MRLDLSVLMLVGCTGMQPSNPAAPTSGPGTTTGTIPTTPTVPGAPTAVDDDVEVAVGGTVLIDLAANDTDPEGALDLSSVTIVDPPQFGMLQDPVDGTVGYRNDGGIELLDSFTYTIHDAEGLVSNVATVSITVVNSPPVAVDDAFPAGLGLTTNLPVLANDSDPDDGVDPSSIVVVTAPANGTVTALPDGTVDYTHDGTTTYVDSFTYNIMDFLGNVSNDAIVDLTITSSVPVDLTPSTGNLIVGDNPLWATKGYRFTALVDFTITGGAWLLQMPNTGYVELTVYDSNGGALAVGTQDLGDGTSRWYQSDLFYTFTAGSTYTVAWYTSQAATSTFDRKDNPSYGYAVNGKLDNVTHYSSLQMGDNAANVYPDALNTWAPFQRLDIVP